MKTWFHLGDKLQQMRSRHTRRLLLIGCVVALPAAVLPSQLASATDTGPGGPAGPRNVTTQCFHVGVAPGGYPAVTGNSRFVPSLTASDRGFKTLDTKFGYALRLRGTVYKKAVWSSTDHYWYFVPERFAIGGNGTVTGGGQTISAAGGNPTGQALGSRTAFRLHSTETSASYGLSFPWGVSGSWESSRRTRKLVNSTWTAAGLSRTSGTLEWNAPLSGSATRSSGLHKISIQSAAAAGGDGPDYWTGQIAWKKPDFYRSSLNSGTASFSGLLPVACSSVRWEDAGRSAPEKPDTTAPTLTKPTAILTSPTSRTASFQISASDNGGAVPQMRVRATGDPDWRAWVPYASTGTVILPDRYGDFTIWFQVRDAAGNLSSARAADIVTRVQDLGAPVISGASVALNDPTSRHVNYTLAASDSLSSVTQMRLQVSGEAWRPWVPYSSSGTVVLPDGYGRFGVTFQVMDAAGNVSAQQFAGAVTRTAAVGLNLVQIDNNGNVRSCGSEAQPCSDVVKRFRVTISSAVLPRTDLLFKAWRNINGTWVETSTSPFMRMSITGTVMAFPVTANLLSGVWRFQAQVPHDADGVTAFGASEYQYLRIG